MRTFFEELRRRKVYRIAAAYFVVGWSIIQISSTVFTAWDLPRWALRSVMVLVLGGFPMALVLAWAFDLTPAEAETTPDREAPERPSRSRTRRNAFLVGGLGLALSFGAGVFLRALTPPRKIEKSIAVLPFDNLSELKENAYFADGVQDDLLTSLSKIGDLKVISRTSVMSYRGNTRNIREIGQTLGVGTVLEGSVRRSGNRVRVNVQLIDAATDEHIWAEDYDRDLTDVFAIQSELANEIASVLKAKLSAGEKAEIARKPTQNSQAYLLYLQAREYVQRPDELMEDMLKAEQLFGSALELDPSFALAHAQMSRLESWVYHANDPSPARLAKAKSAAETAIKLQPNLPEAHLALGYCAYYGDRDYARALREFAIAQRGSPNDADIYVATAAIARRQGKWKEAIADSKKAVSLDPKNGIDWSNLGMTYRAIRDYPAAADAFERGAAVAPNSIDLTGMRATLDFDWKGDLAPTKDLLARLPADVDPQGAVTLARAQVKLIERKYAEALDLIQHSSVEFFKTDAPVLLPRLFVEAGILLAMGEQEKARGDFEQTLPIVEAAVREAPADPFRHSVLGKVYAGVGRKEDAVREGKRAIELLPESLDAADGPTLVVNLAEIETDLGDVAEACSLLEHSLSTPNGVTVQRLKLEPTWDGLRGDPRFQQLLQKDDSRSP